MANKQLQNAVVSVLKAGDTVAAIYVHSVDTSGAFVSPGAGSTQVSVKEILSSSGGSLIDSTNVSLGVTIRAGSAAGVQYTDGDVDASITGDALLFDNSSNTLRPVTLTRGLPVNLVAGQSTTVNVSSLAGKVTVDQNSTIWPVQVSSVAGRVDVGDYSTGVPSSNVRSLVIRQISTGGGASSTQVSVSTGSVRVHQSTAADLNVTVAGYSTITTVSTGSVRVHQSTAADLNVTVANFSTTVNVSSLAGKVLVDQNSTVWQTQTKLQDSSGVNIPASTSLPVNGANGLNVRQVFPTLLSTAFSTLGNNSTSSTVVSSAAGVRHKVYAYSITSTVQAINTLSFASSLASMIWTVQMQSFSSGIAGANLAVSPPGWLFATQVANPLVFKVTGTTGTYHLSFSYFSEA